MKDDFYKGLMVSFAIMLFIVTVGILSKQKDIKKQEQTEEIIQPEEPQPFTPITYHVIECNVAGTDQIDYVIEISTRDHEELGRIIRLLEGGE